MLALTTIANILFFFVAVKVVFPELFIKMIEFIQIILGVFLLVLYAVAVGPFLKESQEEKRRREIREETMRAHQEAARAEWHAKHGWKFWAVVYTTVAIPLLAYSLYFGVFCL